jgi:uncharacterized protein
MGDNTEKSKKQPAVTPWKIIQNFWWIPMILCVVVAIIPRKNSPVAESQLFPATLQLTVSGQNIDLEEALTAEQQQVGLSGRTDLPENRGMLFPLKGHPLPYKISMKRVAFPVDFVFVDFSNVGTVITLQPCVKDCPETKVTEKFDFLIELKGGVANKLGLKPGARVAVSRKKPSGS